MKKLITQAPILFFIESQNNWGTNSLSTVTITELIRFSIEKDERSRTYNMLLPFKDNKSPEMLIVLFVKDKESTPNLPQLLWVKITQHSPC